jgi:hypothetical protein
MQVPTRADYVRVYFTLFECFQQERGNNIHFGHSFEYTDQVLIVFFTVMSIRRITAFKAQHRWLKVSPCSPRQPGGKTAAMPLLTIALSPKLPSSTG